MQHFKNKIFVNNWWDNWYFYCKSLAVVRYFDTIRLIIIGF